MQCPNPHLGGALLCSCPLLPTAEHHWIPERASESPLFASLLRWTASLAFPSSTHPGGLCTLGWHAKIHDKYFWKRRLWYDVITSLRCGISSLLVWPVERELQVSQQVYCAWRSNELEITLFFHFPYLHWSKRRAWVHTVLHVLLCRLSIQNSLCFNVNF